MIRLVLPVIIFILPFSACKHDQGKPIAFDSCGAPAIVSFSKDLKPLFTKNCALSGCHLGISPAGNLNLDASVAYSQLMNHSAGYIDTINPQFSLLYAQMTSVSTPMPPTGNLNACSIGLVLKWIQQKAKDN